MTIIGSCWQFLETCQNVLSLDKGGYLNISRKHCTCIWIYCETMLKDEYRFIIVCMLYVNLDSSHIYHNGIVLLSISKLWKVLFFDEYWRRTVDMKCRYVYLKFKERKGQFSQTFYIIYCMSRLRCILLRTWIWIWILHLQKGFLFYI